MSNEFNKRKVFGVLGILFLTIAFALFPSAGANAEVIGGYIHMSPVKTALELDPGDTYDGSFQITNTGTEPFSYRLYASPYQMANENGDVDYNTNNRYTEITDWITFSKINNTIAPGEAQDIFYTIKVPDNAPGGGQYALLFAETDNPKEDGNFASTVSRIGQLLFVTVNGDTDECAKIISNNINTFMFEPPIITSSLIENCGNVHQEASYVMKVYPLFSDKEIYSNEETPETHSILPETRRFNTLAWTKEQGAPMMGIFNVEQTVKIGKETDTVKKLVFIFPLWLVIIFILLIAAIIFKLVSNSRRRKESKRSSVNTPEKPEKSDRSE